MKTKPYFASISSGTLFLALSHAGSTPSETTVLTKDRPLFATVDWKTDFSKHSMPEADVRLTNGDPVAFLQIGDKGGDT